MERIFSDISLLANLHLRQSNPVSLVHFVTNRCNARCSFCFIDFDDPKTFANELTVDEITKISSTLGPNLQNINITGGEPFARKDIDEIVCAYYANTNIRSIFITTNGSLPERVERLCREKTEHFPKKKLFLQISIDGMREKHDSIRKISGLFDKAMETYHSANAFGPGVEASVALTVSHENCCDVEDLYLYLTRQEGVKRIALNIVRDEGVFKIPRDKKEEILNAYEAVAQNIVHDKKSGRIDGWDDTHFMGRLMNKKNEIWRKTLLDIYMEPKFISPCMASSIFGIIEADGRVRACEILQESIGNLRDFDYDFMSLWGSEKNIALRKWIGDTKCNCHYDCAWSFNILAGRKYQFDLAKALVGL